MIAGTRSPTTCPTCEGRGWIWVEEDADDPCPDCTARIRAELDAELDALHAAAAVHRAAGVDPQLAQCLARHDGEAEPHGIPRGMDGVPF